MFTFSLITGVVVVVSLVTLSLVETACASTVAVSVGAWLLLVVAEVVPLVFSELANSGALVELSAEDIASIPFVSTKSAVVSTLAVTLVVVSILCVSPVVTSSAKAFPAISAKLARADAHENAIRYFLDVWCLTLLFVSITNTSPF